MSLRKEYIIAYDIEDNKIRTTLYNQLLAYGLKSVQKSVFWGCITNAELGAIKSQFNKLLTNKDKVFITKVNMREQKLDYSYGYNPSSFKDWDEYGKI